MSQYDVVVIGAGPAAILRPFVLHNWVLKPPVSMRAKTRPVMQRRWAAPA